MKWVLMIYMIGTGYDTYRADTAQECETVRQQAIEMCRNSHGGDCSRIVNTKCFYADRK